MRFLFGPAAAHFRKMTARVRDAGEEAMERRLARLVSSRRREPPRSPLERLSIASLESQTTPLYDQSVYGSLSLGGGDPEDHR